MLKPTAWIISVFCAFPVSVLDAHFLWKVNTEEPSFLYGTIHSSDTSVRDIPPPVIDALKSSASFHPELELSPETMGHLTAAIFAAGGDPLSSELPADLWERTRTNSERLGIPSMLLERVPLHLAPLLFSNPPNAEFDQIIDVQVYQIANENDLRIVPLETIDEQMNVFLELSREDAIAFLEETLDEFEQDFPGLQKTLQLYVDGDIDALKQYLIDEFARVDLPDLDDALLYRRNEQMTQRLLPYLEKGGAFAAVGAAHMPGEKGMVALLEEAGYEVTRILFTTPVTVE